MKQFVTVEFLLGVHKRLRKSDPITEEGRIYYEVFSNLTTKSELVVDVKEGEVFKQLRDPARQLEPVSVILRKLIQDNFDGKSKVEFVSRRKEYQKVFKNEIDFPELNGSIRLVTQSNQQKPEDPKNIPEIDLTVERLKYYYETYLAKSDSLVYSLTPESSFSWDDLAWIHQPVSGLLVVDRYIFSKISSVSKNLHPLLFQLLKGAYPDTVIQITILTESIDEEFPEDEAVQKVVTSTVKFLKRKLKRNDIHLSVLINKSDQRSIRRLTHDRFIVSNYLWIESGNSFRFFDEKGKQSESVDTTLKVHSNLNAPGFKPIRNRIKGIKKNILPLAETEGEIVRHYGDFSLNPIFDLE